MNQVKRVILKHNLFYRGFHNEPQPNILYPLESRKLLKVAGPDASVFLQGLITNDMKHFDDGAKSMYAMFLNNKGRVLYDTLIHKSKDMFMLECDKQVLSLLLRHLKLYKLKRNVEFGDTNHFKLWALIASPGTLPEANFDNEHIQVYKDPRLEGLGYRILSHVSIENEIVQNMFEKKVTIENELRYKELRYKLGVCEGSLDLSPGSCFPLEANCDYLHGVSFHKGCYIGQELTARVHHTGVVRKRIMPLLFSECVTNLAEKPIISASNKPKSNFGKVTGYVNNCGLGLIRVKEALEASELVVGNYTVKIDKPSWWPIEAPKEKVQQVE